MKAQKTAPLGGEKAVHIGVVRNVDQSLKSNISYEGGLVEPRALPMTRGVGPLRTNMSIRTTRRGRVTTSNTHGLRPAGLGGFFFFSHYPSMWQPRRLGFVTQIDLPWRAEPDLVAAQPPVAGGPAPLGGFQKTSSL